MNVKQQLITLIKALGELIYPHLCAVCGLRLGRHEDTVCLECSLRLTYYRETAFVASERLLASPLFRSLSAPFTYAHHNDTHQMIVALKYQGYRSVADYIVRVAMSKQALRFHPKDIDLILPVPIEDGRLQKRGYNQAALLARALAEQLNLPWSDKHLIRRKGSHSQTAYGRQERMQNAQRAFALSSDPNQASALAGKRILLVDDILTSGSTLLTLCDLLESCGVKDIHVFVAAVTLRRY